jgi:hypothetical protein
MIYKKKILVLSSVFGVLALIYTGILIFSSDRARVRDTLYVWLDPKAAAQADRIELRGDQSAQLIRRGDAWSALGDAMEYPVKQERVRGLLNLLSTRASYPRRGDSSASHEAFGLTESAASRIIIREGDGQTVLLDLLIGRRDATGRELYLRRNNQDQVRAGEDAFSLYLGAPASWYNLRLFQNEVDMVQRVTVVPALPEGAEAGQPASTMVLLRQNRTWAIEGVSDDALEASRIESYIRGILEAEGDDFISDFKADDPVFTQGRIQIEFGDGNSRTLSLGPVAGEGKRSAVVSGVPYVYSLAQWTINRLFQDVSYFMK